jgi:transcriptional regulator with XRE-family HTH domain
MEETLSEFLGARLKEARKRAGLTQKAAAELMSLTHSAVGQWERGDGIPDLINLVAAAECYRASLDTLVWGMGNDIEVRLRALPAWLRDTARSKILGAIEEAEALDKRFPQMRSEVVGDDDKRLRRWSAVNKQKRDALLPPKKAKPRGGGSH